MQPTPPRATRALHTTLALVLTAVLTASCSTSPSPSAGGDAPGTETGAEHVAQPTAHVDGRDLVLVAADGTRTVVASVDDAELLHAEVRPGVADPTTVLVLTRDPERYELRYLTVADGTPTELYWFPSRLQVAPESATVTDVPTLPVWAPDGSGVAWLEWDEDGTRLRTVGWLDHDAGTNPSDDQATYAVGELPVGTQLASWEHDEDGTPVLVTRGEPDDRWRIRLEDGEPIVALEPVG